jgi:hypothetical protein
LPADTVVTNEGFLRATDDEVDDKDVSGVMLSAVVFPARYHSSATGSPTRLLGRDGGSAFSRDSPSMLDRFTGSWTVTFLT